MCQTPSDESHVILRAVFIGVNIIFESNIIIIIIITIIIINIIIIIIVIIIIISFGHLNKNWRIAKFWISNYLSEIVFWQPGSVDYRKVTTDKQNVSANQRAQFYRKWCMPYNNTIYKR